MQKKIKKMKNYIIQRKNYTKMRVYKKRIIWRGTRRKKNYIMKNYIEKLYSKGLYREKTMLHKKKTIQKEIT